MKDYKEITAAVLARKAEYMRKKRARSRATIAAACVLCLALVVSVTVKPLSVYFNAKSIENLPKSVSNYNELYSAISAIIRQNRVVNDLAVGRAHRRSCLNAPKRLRQRRQAE